MRRPLVLVSMLLGLLLVVPAYGDDDEDDKPVRPPTKVTQTLGADTYKKMEAVQQAFDAKDYAAALRGLDGIRAEEDKLNDYEKATLYNLYAAVYYAQDKPAKAIDAYTMVLEQPELPEAIRNNTLFALAQMHFVTEDYDKAVVVLKQWFEVVPEPSADAYMLLAQAYYQQEKYAESEQQILDGLRLATERRQTPKENWLALLRAVYYELDNYERSAKVLEILVRLYPKETYFLQLSGMYGLMGDQKAQLATLHAANEAGMVSKQADLLNLARLYLVEEAPYPAVELLAAAFEDKRIKRETETLQLYAQALALAKEYEKQIPVLQELAELTGKSQHYVYLGQAQSELGRWAAAVESFEAALDGKDIDDADSIRMQLGTALFNAGQLAEARRTFLAAADSEKHAETAANWIKFVSAEIERQRALSAAPGDPAQPAG
jgi:tetratricopeptide (TPR) repeat protein